MRENELAHILIARYTEVHSLADAANLLYISFQLLDSSLCLWEALEDIYLTNTQRLVIKGERVDIIEIHSWFKYRHL